MNEKYLGTAKYTVTSKGIEISLVIPPEFAEHHNIEQTGTCEVKISDFRSAIFKNEPKEAYLDKTRLDVDRLAMGIVTSERRKSIGIREMIKELEDQCGKNIPIEKLIDMATKKGIRKDQVLDAIEKLKLSGDLYEPDRGYIGRIV